MENYKVNIKTVADTGKVIVSTFLGEEVSPPQVNYYKEENVLNFYLPQNNIIVPGMVLVFETIDGEITIKEEVVVKSVTRNVDCFVVAVAEPINAQKFYTKTSATTTTTISGEATIEDNNNLEIDLVGSEYVGIPETTSVLPTTLKVNSTLPWEIESVVCDSCESDNSIAYGVPHQNTYISVGPLNKKTNYSTITKTITKKSVYWVVTFKQNVRIKAIYKTFTITFPLEYNFGTDMAVEDNIHEYFVEDIKKRALSTLKVIDMEKVAFSPMFQPTNSSSPSFNPIDFIEFNFHFLERDEEGWKVNGQGRWNGIAPGTNVSIKNAALSDKLKFLNFNDDDVRYQQNKLKKTFIRLSFYDTMNPVTQHLLYYSTIFYDTNELFGKYVKYKPFLDKMGKESVVDSDDNVYRVDTRLTVYNKYNSEKSSEGFYIYLFKDEVTENSPKDIYMKVEFNHAGYGRTVPFTKPYLDISQKIKQIPFEDFFKTQYIKLKCVYIPTENKYAYYAAKDETSVGIYEDKNNRKLVFNLFEANLA